MPLLGTWNHVYVAGDDWSQTAIINLYRHAYTQRLLSLGTWMFGATAMDPIADGFPVADWTFWRALQFDDSFSSSSWVVYQDYTGQAATTPIDWNYIKANALGGNGYTRKYEKKYHGPSATDYTDGNAFVNGDYARNTVDRKTYLRSAGAWTVAPGHLPDVVSTFGNHQEGDILTVEMLNEIRDVFNLFTAWSGGSLGNWTSGDLDTAGDTDSGNQTTIASTKAIVEASFLANQVEADSGFAAEALAELVFDGTHYQGTLFRRRAKFNAGENVNGLASVLDYYCIGFSGSGAMFDASGDPVLDALLSKWDSQPGTGIGATIVSDWLGSLAIPNWCADPVGLALSSSGYGIVSTVVIFRFDVAGGFTELP